MKWEGYEVTAFCPNCNCVTPHIVISDKPNVAQCKRCGAQHSG